MNTKYLEDYDAACRLLVLCVNMQTACKVAEAGGFELNDVLGLRADEVRGLSDNGGELRLKGKTVKLPNELVRWLSVCSGDVYVFESVDNTGGHMTTGGLWGTLRTLVNGSMWG